MANQKQNIQMKFYVMENEKRLIDEKMPQLSTASSKLNCLCPFILNFSSTTAFDVIIKILLYH